jgi:hypothetical protein
LSFFCPVMQRSRGAARRLSLQMFFGLAVIRMARKRTASKAECAQPGMIGGPWPRSVPEELAVVFWDGNVIDTRVPFQHQAGVIEQPVFITKRSKPVVPGVMPFVGKSHRDPIACENPKLP